MLRASRLPGAEPRLGLRRNGGPQSPSAEAPVSAPAHQQRSATSEQRGDPPDASAPASAEAAQAAGPQAGRLPPPSMTSEAGQPGAEAPDPLGLGRPVLVYSRRALEAAEQGGAGCAALWAEFGCGLRSLTQLLAFAQRGSGRGTSELSATVRADSVTLCLGNAAAMSGI